MAERAMTSVGSPTFKVEKLINLVETYSDEFKNVTDEMADNILDLKARIEKLEGDVATADDNTRYLDDRLAQLEALRDSVLSLARDVAAEHELVDTAALPEESPKKSLQDTLRELKANMQQSNPPLDPPGFVPSAPPVLGRDLNPGPKETMAIPPPVIATPVAEPQPPVEEPPKEIGLVEIDAMLPPKKKPPGFFDKILSWADNKLEEKPAPKPPKPPVEPKEPKAPRDPVKEREIAELEDIMEKLNKAHESFK